MADENKAAHLQMIQSVISRMAGNSFSLKTLAVTFSVAVFAYFAAVPGASKVSFIGAGVGVLIFWLLDAQYLRLERLFRALYDNVRSQSAIDYSMETSAFQAKVQSTIRIGLSWSVLWLYLFLICALALLAYSR